MHTETPASAAAYMTTSMIGSLEDQTPHMTGSTTDYNEFSGKTIPQLVELLNATTMIASAEFASRFMVDVRVPADRTPPCWLACPSLGLSLLPLPPPQVPWLRLPSHKSLPRLHQQLQPI